MSQKILITKFNYNLPHTEFRNLLMSVAGDFAAVPGCQWKIWLIDEDKNEGGAIYLFNNENALQTFTESPLVQSVMSHPALSNFDFRVTDVIKETSAITRAPIAEPVPA
ncbi:MAG: YdhR family protein [Ginsengibacter sp.]